MYKRIVGTLVCMLLFLSIPINGAINLPTSTTPSIINITNGVYWVGVEYTFFITFVHPEGHEILIRIDWGDGNISDWLGPYGSGETVSFTHYWSETGNYYIKVSAKDEYGQQSEWLTFNVTINPPHRFFKSIEINGKLKTKPWKGLIMSIMYFNVASVTRATIGNAQIGPLTCHNYKFLAVAFNVQSYNEVTLNIEGSAPFVILINY